MENKKIKLYSERKLRHTIICGIPGQGENMDKIVEEVSKEDVESILNRSN